MINANRRNTFQDTSPQNDSDEGRLVTLESCTKNGHAEIRAGTLIIFVLIRNQQYSDVEQVVTQGSAFPGSQEGMERSTQEASEGCVTAEMYDRDPVGCYSQVSMGPFVPAG